MDLGYNKIGNIGAQYLVEILKTNTVLRTLKLKLCNIDDVGVIYLADALKINKVILFFIII